MSRVGNVFRSLAVPFWIEQNWNRGILSVLRKKFKRRLREQVGDDLLPSSPHGLSAALPLILLFLFLLVVAVFELKCSIYPMCLPVPLKWASWILQWQQIQGGGLLPACLPFSSVFPARYIVLKIKGSKSHCAPPP